MTENHLGVREIREDAIVVRGPDGDATLPNDDVFVRIGRAAPLDFFRRSGIAIAGEWTRARALACALFVLFVAALVDWKSGGVVQHAFRAAGWFPYFLPRALSAALCWNSASVATIATVFGFGVCAAARSKKPWAKDFTGSGPNGSIEKYLG